MTKEDDVDDLDECICGHDRVDHEDGGQGPCLETASSGYQCSCPAFKAQQ